MDQEREKRELYFRILKAWFWSESHGRSVAKYIKEKAGEEIAIYGLSDLGGLLLHECEKYRICVKYVIDRNKLVLCDYPVLSPEEDLPTVKSIIVTPEYYFLEIKDYLHNRTNADIISFMQMISEASGVFLK